MTRNGRRLLLYPIAVVVLCGLVYGGFVYESEPAVEQLVTSADALAKLRAFDKSIEYLDRVLRREPDHRYAHIILGYCYGEKEEYERAIGHYRRALDVTAPNDQHAGLLRLYIAQIQNRSGKPEEAIATAAKVTDDPHYGSQAWIIIAGVHEENGRIDLARASFEGSFKAAPSARSMLLLAALEERQGRLDEAARALEGASFLCPYDLDVALARARFKCVGGDHQGAVRVLLPVAEVWPEIVHQFLLVEEAVAPLADDPAILDSLGLEELGPAGGEN